MTQSTAPILQIDGVSKAFGAVTAVDDISLDLARNEFFALLGPSGCGKTTLLRMLAGFETPDSGAILLNDQDITPLPPEKRPLNLMFQSYALFPHTSVRKNLNYGLEMERLSKAEINKRVDEMLHVTHLSDFADRKPAQLSGGQRQRVALARALVKHPQVLLLDEPLGALDKKLRQHMQLELKRLQDEIGITFIIVTHDQEEALVMADRMAVLKDGKICQCDSPETIYNQPIDPFVANFIGDMNFIKGFATQAGTFSAPELELTDITIPKEIGEASGALMAIRPEAISIAPTGGNLNGTIKDIAYHGLDRVLHVAIEANDTPIQVRTSAIEGRSYAIGDGIGLTVDGTRASFFAD